MKTKLQSALEDISMVGYSSDIDRASDKLSFCIETAIKALHDINATALEPIYTDKQVEAAMDAYLGPLWRSTRQSDINKIRRAMRKALRAAFDAAYSEALEVR